MSVALLPHSCSTPPLFFIPGRDIGGRVDEFPAELEQDVDDFEEDLDEYVT